MFELAQAELISLLQTLLNGGLPLLLLTALIYVGRMYKKEKEARDEEVKIRVKAVETASEEMAKLEQKYSDKVEELLRERIDSETANQKIQLESKEAIQSVIMAIGNFTELLESMMEEE
jgi:hypothetical protein